MRIWVSGFARDLGPTRLFNQLIKDANTEQPDQPRHQRLRLYRDSHGVELESFTSTRLNGDYRLHVKFSDEDILHLFLSCYPDLRASLEQMFAGLMSPRASEDK